MAAIQQFKDAYGALGNNFMTPMCISVERADRFVVELSTNLHAGASMIGTLYGVTVAECTGKHKAVPRHDLSACFTSREDAETYIKSLTPRR